MDKNKIPTHVIHKVRKLLDELFWEYDRMSSSGKKTLDEIAKHLNVPTQAEVQEIIDEKNINDCIESSKEWREETYEK